MAENADGAPWSPWNNAYGASPYSINGWDSSLWAFFQEAEDRRNGYDRSPGSYVIEGASAERDARVNNTREELYRQAWEKLKQELSNNAPPGEEGSVLDWMNGIGDNPDQLDYKNPLSGGSIYGAAGKSLYDIFAAMWNNSSAINPDMFGDWIRNGSAGDQRYLRDLFEREGMRPGWRPQDQRGDPYNDNVNFPNKDVDTGGGGGFPGGPGGGGPPIGGFPGYPGMGGGGGGVALTGPQMNPQMPMGGPPQGGPPQGGGGGDLMQQLMAMVMQGGMQGGM